MEKFLATAAGILAATMMAASANATTLDFAAYADGANGGSEGGIVNGSSIVFDGLSVQFVSFSTTIPGGVIVREYFPYFDSGDAGLGVCKRLDSAAGNGAPGGDCTPSSDDNVTGSTNSREGIALLFGNSTFDLREINFRNVTHDPIVDGTNDAGEFVEVNHNASGFVQYTFAQIVQKALAGDFMNTTSIAFRYVNTQFYINTMSDVPIPGALPLLLSGIAGLGFASRRKKKAA